MARKVTAAVLLLAAVLLAEAPQAVHAVTSALTERVALASDAGSTPPGGSGVQQARAAGVPVDVAFLAEHPEVAAQVPLTAPPEPEKYSEVPVQSFSDVGTSARFASTAKLAAAPFQPILATSLPVAVSGTYFLLNGSPIFPSGTNWYDILKIENYIPTAITNNIKTHWDNGVRLLRCWGHVNGFGAGEQARFPFQPAPGVFNETNLQRFDFVLDELAKVGIRIIPTMVNFYHNLGGIQWYVDNVLGNGTTFSGGVQERFYTDPDVKAAYKLWLLTITQRVNTINGRKYSEDPTIFAWELCNECHTSDNYEFNLKQSGIDPNAVPGQLLHNWQVEMSAYLKNDLNITQMASSGGEGYRVRGTFDPDAAITYPFRNYMNTGLKGEDFARSLTISTLDFATTHCYPSNFGVLATAYDWVNEAWIGEHQALALAAGRPLLFEEFGMENQYPVDRDVLLRSMLAASQFYKLRGSLVWSLYAFGTFNGATNYFFGYSQPGTATMLQEFEYQLARAGNSSLQPPFLYPPFPGGCKICTNVPPRNSNGTCFEQVQSAPAACNTTQFLQGDEGTVEGYCQISCGRCNCNVTTPIAPPPPPLAPPPVPSPPDACTDNPPGSDFTCAQQLGFESYAGEKCCADFMLRNSSSNPGGFCERTCGRCDSAPGGRRINCVGGIAVSAIAPPPAPPAVGLPPGSVVPAAPPPACSCTDVAPDTLFTCVDQKRFDDQVAPAGTKCCDPFYLQSRPGSPQGLCEASCGRCTCNGGPQNVCIGGILFPMTQPPPALPASAAPPPVPSPPAAAVPPPPPGCTCTDVPPDSAFNCTDQKRFDDQASPPGTKCCTSFYLTPREGSPAGFCEASCGRCTCNGGPQNVCIGGILFPMTQPPPAQPAPPVAAPPPASLVPVPPPPNGVAATPPPPSAALSAPPLVMATPRPPPLAPMRGKPPPRTPRPTAQPTSRPTKVPTARTTKRPTPRPMRAMCPPGQYLARAGCLKCVRRGSPFNRPQPSGGACFFSETKTRTSTSCITLTMAAKPLSKASGGALACLPPSRRFQYVFLAFAQPAVAGLGNGVFVGTSLRIGGIKVQRTSRGALAATYKLTGPATAQGLYFTLDDKNKALKASKKGKTVTLEGSFRDPRTGGLPACFSATLKVCKS